jgi:hypothetical protein
MFFQRPQNRIFEIFITADIDIVGQVRTLAKKTRNQQNGGVVEQEALGQMMKRS